ncbi:MAG: Lrp/AsnC family transcriptional regulator [archaeon GB-1867-097]|nr:Lrp/AsnC family transcriptional regulator [Candidatus Culexmicrobium thermophilum]MCS7384782.1 Lrp/AsnC family transcriptional regulator [Candidatus Culexmicrobium thermophilum]
MVRISNQQILRILMENSRTPIMKIAEKLGVSETAIRKRIRKMEKDGIIKKYTVEIDPRKLGYNVISLIGLDTAPEKLITTIDRLKEEKDIIHLYSASGDHMILAECWFRNFDEMKDFNEKLAKMEGVTKICPAIILEKIK